VHDSIPGEEKDAIKNGQGTHDPNRRRNIVFFIQSRRAIEMGDVLHDPFVAPECTLDEERQATKTELSTFVPNRARSIAFLLQSTQLQTGMRYCRIPTQSTKPIAGQGNDTT
jgi:hypothetical protein